MKNRFAHFLVARSKVILIIFILLALACAALIPLVNVNRDMTKYLAEDSAMRHGLDLMRAEFGDEDSSSLEVMFDDLDSDRDKSQTLQKLENVRYVESVDYKLPADDEDQTYNRDGYTRYILNCDYEQYSGEAESIWTEVRETFGEDHEIELGGSINDSCENGLPLWIIATAVALVTLILLIMANSWIEPVAFLITIGIAVLINMGTYCLFPSISKTTFGIVGILQLALSMDYSIMLLNRYRQQRNVIPDKNEAMQRALSLSFGAITGSSLTTFAGLLALVFMSFTIGADIGMALAKGVIVSLICIFTVLPALLLGFDGLILRTVKKTLPFDLPKLSGFQYRMRVPLTLLFLALFVTAFIARSGVDFSYSQGHESPIDDVFGHTNTIVMLYDEEDGEAASDLADALADGKSVTALSADAKAGELSATGADDPAIWNDQIRTAVCYESSLGKQRRAGNMKDFIDDMSEEEEDAGDVDLRRAMVRLIYYDYYTGKPDFRMTIPQFVSYLKNDVLEDPDFGDSIDGDVRDKIDDMERFTDKQKLTTRMNAAGLADFFDMKESDARQLLLYYQIKCGSSAGVKMTLPGFVSFLINDVASDPDYGSMISSSALKKLKSLRIYTNKKKMTRKVNYRKAAKRLGMNAARMRLVYVYYHMKHDSGEVASSMMSISDLAAVLTDMSEDKALKSQFGGEEIQQLIAGLQQIGQMDPSVYDVPSMAQALQGYGIPLDEETLMLVYAFRELSEDPACCKASVQRIVHFMLNNKTLRSSMGKKQKKQLRKLRKIIDTSVRGTRLSPGSLGSILGMKSSDVRSIYLLYQYKHGDTSGWRLSPQQFVNFLVDKVLSDPDMRSRIGSNADDLKAAKKLISHVVAGTKFTYKGLADLLDDFSGSFGSSDGDSGDTGIDEEDLSLLYELYGSEHYYNKKWTMDLTQLVSHLDENMVDRPAFASAMEEDQIDKVHDMREDMDEAADLLEGDHYGRLMVTAEIDEDSDESRAFMQDLTEYADSRFSQDTYFIGNTPMAYEMSRTFRGELNRITLITALFIFIIVLLTFRRLITPLILVLIIQCAVFLTMGVLRAVHMDMNYLALLIVQSLMMGATIDYAIIYSSYYVESRGMMSIRDALQASYKGSLQTILTSAIMLIAAVGLLSFAFSEPATRQICRILSVGCLIATILVIFLLPAMLACLDRFVTGRKKGT